jgi:hypothetical protein
MTHGFDTGFLVAFESNGPSGPCSGASPHPSVSFNSNGDDFALAPQVLAEFIHVVTDQRRFTSPLAIDAALLRAQAWWAAA